MRPQYKLSGPNGMAHSDTICVRCSEPLDSIDLAAEPRIPCPRSGSTARTFDSIGGRLKRPSLPSNKKLRRESFSAYEFSHDRQKMVRKVRIFDKETNEYVERVTDVETGEVIHECAAPEEWASTDRQHPLPNIPVPAPLLTRPNQYTLSVERPPFVPLCRAEWRG